MVGKTTQAERKPVGAALRERGLGPGQASTPAAGRLLWFRAEVV